MSILKTLSSSAEWFYFESPDGQFHGGECVSSDTTLSEVFQHAAAGPQNGLQFATISFEGKVLHFKPQRTLSGFRQQTGIKIPKAELVSHFPEKTQWAEWIEKSSTEFDKDELHKVVLSRRSLIKSQITVEELFAQPGKHYRIAVKERNKDVFFSKTPEMLFDWRDGRLETVAIAGTRRGLETESLAASQKDGYEHQVVVDAIQGILKKYSTRLRVGARDTLILPVITHLKTSIIAEGVKFESLVDLIQELHPTPAVMGWPYASSREWIKSLEDRDRNLYAGAIGYISPKRCHLAVGIRSGYVKPEGLEVITGVGLVKGSEPESEWQELNAKLEQVLGVSL